jgi:hypothetical protein
MNKEATMRRFITLSTALLLAAAAGADEETLLSGQIEHGGFGGPNVKFTEMKDKFAVLVGGRGGWIINHSFVIGGGGYGLVNQNIDERFISPDTTIYMTMGYGGLELEYIASSNRLLHFSISSLIGAGGVDYIAKARSDDWEHHHYNTGAVDAFFIFEPGINSELNVLRFFRVDTGVSYRFVSGISTVGLSDNDLSGISANITLKFGKF